MSPSRLTWPAFAVLALLPVGASAQQQPLTLPRVLPGQETRSPDDFELFLEGILEAPRILLPAAPDKKRYVPAARVEAPSCGPAGCPNCRVLVPPSISAALRPAEEQKPAVRSTALSPDGRWLASLGTDNVLSLWEVEPGHERRQVRQLELRPGTVFFVGRGRLLAFRSQEGLLRVWDVADLAGGR
jgi:hypothetical protein